MRLLGSRKLIRQLSRLAPGVRDNLNATINKQVQKGVRIARVLVPEDTGQLKGWINGRVDVSQNGVYGIIDAAPDTPEAQKKARAVEFGRTRGDAGIAAAQPYIRPTQQYLAKGYRAAIKRAINKAAKETVRG